VSLLATGEVRSPAQGSYFEPAGLARCVVSETYRCIAAACYSRQRAPVPPSTNHPPPPQQEQPRRRQRSHRVSESTASLQRKSRTSSWRFARSRPVAPRGAVRRERLANRRQQLVAVAGQDRHRSRSAAERRAPREMAAMTRGRTRASRRRPVGRLQLDDGVLTGGSRSGSRPVRTV